MNGAENEKKKKITFALYNSLGTLLNLIMKIGGEDIKGQAGRSGY